MQILLTFFDWAFANGDKMASDLEYVPLPDSLKALVRKQWTEIRDGTGKAIAYNPDAFPYFFVDTNGNGTADKDEAVAANRYNVWTPRLLKAAYNYQFVTKDPGAFAHNSTYAIELLYDSLSDLGGKVSVDLSKAKRP